MGIRPGTGFTVDDLDYIGRGIEERYDCYGTAEILNRYKEGISTGRSIEGISELGHLHRQLLQESDFHAVGRHLLKKLSPEEENEKFGFDGKFLPEKLRLAFLQLEKEGVNTTNLKNAISLAQEDQTCIDWISENWETFLDRDNEDAMSNVSYGLDEVENLEDSEEASLAKVRSGSSRDNYALVESFYKNFYKEASERRVYSLKIKIREIQQITSVEEIEKELKNLSYLYQEDKTILNAWSPSRKAEDRKLILHLFYRKRDELARKREDGLTRDVLDLETIRGQLWYLFDRESQTQMIEGTTRPCNSVWTKNFDSKRKVIKEEGFLTEDEIAEIIRRGKPDPRKVILVKTFSKASIWEIEKTKAFCDLNFTRSQWNRIYDFIWEKLTDILCWKIDSIQSYRDLDLTTNYLRRFQYRVNSDRIGKSILKKTNKIKTETGKRMIRILLSSCQSRLEEGVKKEITKILLERIVPCVRR